MRYRDDGGTLVKIETGIDLVQKEVDAFDEKEGKRKKKRHGAYRYPVPVGIDGTPRNLSGLDRESFFRGTAMTDSADTSNPLIAEGLIDPRRPAGGYDPSEYGDPS